MTLPDEPSPADEGGFPSEQPSPWAGPHSIPSPIPSQPTASDPLPAADQQPAYPPPGQVTPGYPPPAGYPAGGYPGYPQGGYPGSPQPGYPQQGYPPPTYAPSGHTQPGYAPPGYPPPGYAPPGYPPPAWAPPGYAPPAYGPPAYTPPAYAPSSYQPGNPQPHLNDPARPLYYDPNAPAPYLQNAGKPKSTGAKLLLWIVPIVLVACIGTGIVVIIKSGFGNRPTASVPPVATATAGSPSTNATATGRTPGLDTFTMPSNALSMPRSYDPTQLSAIATLQDTLDGSTAGMKSGPSTAAVYHDISNPKRILIIVGLPVVVDDVAGAANTIYIAFSTQMTMQPKQAYPSGPMGGSMWCADGTQKTATVSVPVSVCVAVDKGGMLLTMAFNQAATDLSWETGALRSAIES